LRPLSLRLTGNPRHNGSTYTGKNPPVFYNLSLDELTESPLRALLGNTAFRYCYYFCTFFEERFLFSLMNSLPIRKILERELVPFSIALIVAQLYFKWGSFALELVGFIITWFLLGYLAQLLARMINK